MRRSATFIRAAWNHAKAGASINLGPIAVNLRLSRAVPVSNNQARRARAWVRSLVGWPSPAGLVAGREAQQHRASGTDAKVASARTGVIVGVGQGLGMALAHRLASDGMKLALVSRNATRLDPLVTKLRASNPKIYAYGCDATNERSVKSIMGMIEKDLGTPNLVIYNVQSFTPGSILDTEVAAFEEAWRANCLGAFIVGRESARLMAREQRGTVIFVGGTSSRIGRDGYLNLAVGKFGLRALAQVMARELGPHGIHVVHLVVDADIAAHDSWQDNAGQMRSEDLAELICSLHAQPRSVWTHELDVRPWNEKFWEHC